MKKIYKVTFNGVILLNSQTKKGALDFLKKINKKDERIKTIIKKIEADGGQVFNTVYVDKHENDYEFPIKQKGI